MTQRRSAVVTGAGSGIGRAVFEKLLYDGWYVVGIESAPVTAASLREVAEANGAVVVGDVRDKEVLDAATHSAVEVEPLGGWVNNAAINRETNLHEPMAQDVDDVLAVNLLAYYWGSSTAVRTYLSQRSGGSLVNISSIHARAAYTQAAAYDVAKAGVEALSRYIAVEYGALGIRANSVAPAAVMTPMSRARIDASPEPREFEEAIAAAVPLRRIADPSEIASVVAFLLSDGASYVTGQSIGVDGGMSASSGPFEPDPALLKHYGMNTRDS